MFDSLFALLVLAVGFLAAERAGRVWGRAHGIGLWVGLGAVYYVLPLGGLLALVLGIAGLKVAELEARRQLRG
jgi:hypothetical protein